MSTESRHALVAGLHELGMTAADAEVDALLDYLKLLGKWNRIHNLVSPDSYRDGVSRHLLDSLAILPWLPSKGSVLDMGSGAGLPGLPLAVMRPAQDFISVEAIAKKCVFQRQAVVELGLNNVNILNQRIEAVSPVGADVVLSRAFTAPGDFLRLAAPHVVGHGVALVMLGREDTLPADGQDGWDFIERVGLAVPGLESRRALAVYRRM